MNRQSLAPTRGAAGMRQSMAAGYGGMGMGGEPLSHSQGSEYSQANPPQTEMRNRMYSSVASGGRGDAGYLRASTAVGRDYAPPRCVLFSRHVDSMCWFLNLKPKHPY
jgi:hypothetical protein